MSANGAFFPYKGLSPFQDTDRDVPFFFGRDRERELVEANLMASRLTVLYGETGVGKSSLLRAGVAHHLRSVARGNLEARSEPGLAVVVFDSWRDDPVHALRAAVADEVTAALGGSVKPADDGGRSLGDALGLWQELLGGDLYVILDQAEEYFLYHGGEDGGGTFAAQFPEVVNDPDLRVNFILAVRDDSLAKLDAFRRHIPNVFGNYLRLEHLDREAARAAIVEPVAEYNRLVGTEDAVTIEPRLVAAVLEQVATGKVDVGQTGRGAVESGSGDARIETPYLQLVLRRLWDEERAAGSCELRLATLERLGGAEQIVRDHVERALSDLSPEEKDMAASLFDHLITPSGTKIAHEASDLAEYAGTTTREVMPVLTKLGEERILRSVEGGGGRDSRYEIFHDVLAEPILSWKAGHETSRALEAADAQARRRHRRLAAVAAVSVVALVVLAGLTLFAFAQRSTSASRERTAKSRELAANALTQLGNDPEQSLRLALDAENVQQNPSVDTALRTALVASRVRRSTSVQQPVQSIAVARDGDLVVATKSGTTRFDAELRRVGRLPSLGRFLGVRGDDLLFLTRRGLELRSAEGKLRQLIPIRPGANLEVHNLRTGEVVGHVRMPREIRFAAIGPRGTLLAVSDGSKRVVVVNALTGYARFELPQSSPVTSLAFGPGAHLIATGGQDGTSRLWKIATGKARFVLRGHVGPVRDIAFSPRADFVASVSSDGTARVFSLRDGTPVAVMSGHAGPVTQVAFSPDGTRIVTASEDATARVWKAETGAQLAVLLGQPGTVTAARFVGDGTDVVTGSDDGSVRLWYSLQQPVLDILAQLPRPVVRVAALRGGRVEAVTDDGRGFVLDSRGRHVAERTPAVTVAAKSGDGSTATIDGDVVRIRRPDGAVVVLRGHTAPVTTVHFSPDGALVVTASRDTTARIWDARSGAPLHTLRRYFDTVNDAEFSPNGQWVVTAGPSTAALWSAGDGAFWFYLRGHKGRVTSATFDRAGNRIITSGEDGTVRTYDCDICRSGAALDAVARRRLAGAGRPGS